MISSSDIHVAVGVVVVSDRILITQRSTDVDQGGFWEFPGGKIEPGESQRQGLDRELKEELGVEVVSASPLVSVYHDYGHIQVLLHTFLITRISSRPTACEGQPMRWVSYSELTEYVFPKANQPIIQAVQCNFRLSPQDKTVVKATSCGE